MQSCDLMTLALPFLSTVLYVVLETGGAVLSLLINAQLVSIIASSLMVLVPTLTYWLAPYIRAKKENFKPWSKKRLNGIRCLLIISTLVVFYPFYSLGRWISKKTIDVLFPI